MSRLDWLFWDGRVRMAGLLSEIAWKTVPTLLLIFLCTGYRYAGLYLLPHLWYHSSRRLAVLWIVEFHATLLPLVYCFYLVAFKDASPGLPPKHIPPEVLSNVPSTPSIKACTKEGGLEVFCTVCRRYQPLRARHCKRHNQCTIGFDHCCPWFDSCINLYTVKPFVAFVVLAPALLLPSAALLFSVVRAHIDQVSPYWDSEALHSLWWSRKRSWALGPIYRYFGGLVHCYWQWQEQHNYANLYSPHLSALIFLVLCILISMVGLAMVAISWRQLSKNQLTPEIERSKRWKKYLDGLRGKVKPTREWDQHRYIWVPPELSGSGQGEVRFWDPAAVDLFDLGARKNLNILLGESLLDFVRLSEPPPAAPGYLWEVNKGALDGLPLAVEEHGKVE